MKLFVFGFGYTTQRFVELFADDFDMISGTVRQTDKGDELKRRGLDAILFEQKSDITTRIADADVILVSVPPGRSGDPVLAAFSEQIATSAARHIAYLSTIGVYGDHGGAWIDEATPPSPQVERAKARISAEAAWSAIAGDRLSILRLAGIYGRDRNSLTKLRDGTARRIVKPGQVFNRIHVDDASRAIKAATAHDGGTWNVCDDEPAPPQDVVAYAASLMGIAPPPEQDFATAEMTPMGRSFYATSNRISNARLKRDLGVTLAYPTYREGLQALWQAGDDR